MVLPCLAVGISVTTEAATYYVRNGGSDSEDGRSHEAAWATVDKVNSHAFSPGDVVLFYEGDVWKGTQLVVDWGGTSSEHAVVGSYYLDGGQPRAGYRQERPVIDGADKVPGSMYDALLKVTADRVRVENLAVMNSEGRGVTFSEVDGGQIVNVYISNTYDGGIKFIRGSDGLAENNYVTDSDRVWIESDANWSAAISAVEYDNIVFRGNVVDRVYGEGINVNHNSADALIENNLVFGARAVGIYADASPRPTIRRNMVIGTSDSQFWRSGDTVGAGIVLNNENYHYSDHGGSLNSSVQTRNGRIYSNLVAYAREGIGLWGALDGSSFDGTLIYNNTLVDNDTQLALQKRPAPGSELVNNIALSISSGTRDIDNNALNGIKAATNYFSQGDPGGDLSHNGNRYEGLQLKRMSDWRSIAAPEDVTWEDFSQVQGSSGIGAGSEQPLVAADKVNTYNLDYKLREHSTPVDMGAIRFGATSSNIPKAPAALETRAK